MSAVEAGFADQSHFIREFRRFADLAPKEAMTRTPQNADFVQSAR